MDKKSNLLPRQKEVFSEESHPEESNEVIIENEVTSSTQAPAVESPSPTQSQAGNNILAYRYPGAEILSSSENSLNLKSSDDVGAITNWYKAKIESENLNVESFVETSANDKVLNELVGADGQKEIKVEIKKESGTQLVEISVKIAPFLHYRINVRNVN